MSVNYLEMAYTLVGGLGLFFYGMHTLSESLQGIAGDMMRKVINLLTTNRIVAVLVGITVTAVVQSSSVTTVMVVGFVNASLMNLTQALGVILGANIGTTLTGWIIAIKIGKYGLPLLGIGAVFYLFGKQHKVKMSGKLAFALGAVFFGLQNMSTAFKPLRSDPTFKSYLTLFTADTLWSVLICVLIGAALTMVVQSSSAMLGITIALASTGVITFQTAAALVLGENIGTTITALLACIGTSHTAKRAAVGHTIFNVLGVAIMVAIFHPYVQFVEWLIPNAADAVNATNGEKPYVAAHIAAVHSIFNISATIIFLPFLPILARIVSTIIPEMARKRHHLTNLANIGQQIPTLALEQATKELERMSNLVKECLEKTKEAVLSNSTEKQLVERVRRLEDITDIIQLEITVFLGDIMEAKLSQYQSNNVMKIIQIAEGLESIADYCRNIVQYKERLLSEQLHFNEQTREELTQYLDQIISFYEKAVAPLDEEDVNHLEYCLKETKELGYAADKIKKTHLKRIRQGEYPPTMGLTFSDMVVSMRRIKNHALNVAENVHGLYGVKLLQTEDPK